MGQDGLSIAMLIVGLIGSILIAPMLILGGLRLLKIAIRHRDFAVFMLGGFFWLAALMVASVGVSIVAAHFDLMQMGHSAFDVATYSVGRVCLVLMNVFFFGWLLVSAFQLLSEKPRK